MVELKTDFKLSVECNLCQSKTDIECNKADYDKWKNGEACIQDVLSYVSADKRELLISATCGKCFDELFPPMEENEEE